MVEGLIWKAAWCMVFLVKGGKHWLQFRSAREGRIASGQSNFLCCGRSALNRASNPAAAYKAPVIMNNFGQGYYHLRLPLQNKVRTGGHTFSLACYWMELSNLTIRLSLVAVDITKGLLYSHDDRDNMKLQGLLPSGIIPLVRVVPA